MPGVPVREAGAPGALLESEAPGRSKLLLCDLGTVFVLWWRDLRRFLRDRMRILAMLAQPLIYFLVFGYGLGNEFRGDEGFLVGEDYLHFLFPGVLGMVLLFPSFYSAVAVVWDREFGFLKEILASPASRTAVVLGKVLGGTTLSLLQAAAFLGFGYLWGLHPGPGEWLVMLGIMSLLAFGFTALGLTVAPLAGTHEGFQVLTSFLLLPLFLLGGVFFPLWAAPERLKLFMKADPLTYGVDAMRHVLLRGFVWQEFVVSLPLGTDLLVLASFALSAFILALVSFRRTA